MILKNKIDKNFNVLISTILVLLLLIVFNENNFSIDYKIAKQQSLEKNIPLLLCFEEKYSNIKNLREIKNYYIICILTKDKDEKLFEEYKIKKTPSYVIVDQEAKQICSIEGEESRQKIMQWLFSNIRKNQTK